MPTGARHSRDTASPARPDRGWMGGIVAGQVLGLGVALLIKATIPGFLAALLIGTAVGSLKGIKKPPQRKVAPRQDKRIRAYVFQALAETSKKLDEVIINEEFNSASGGGESDRRAMKQAQPKLAVPMPPTPKMGGMH